MRNGTLFGTRELVDKFAEDLRLQAPSGVTSAIEFVPEGARDAVIRWSLGRRTVLLVVRADLALEGWAPDPVNTSAHINVIVAPFIPPRLRPKIEQSGWSYWDPTGNMLVQNDDPFILVRRSGDNRSPHPSTRGSSDLKSLKGRTVSEVLVALLSEGGFATSVRDFARQHQLPPTAVSRVFALLREENLLRLTAGGPLVVEDRLAVAHRWAEDYSFMRTFRPRRYFSILGTDLALERLRSIDTAYAVTGVRAANEWLAYEGRAPLLAAPQLWVYTNDLESLERTLDLAPDPKEGDIQIAPVDFISREFSRPGGDGVRYVAPWRIVGDLLSTSGRPAAVGEELAVSLVGPPYRMK